MLHKNTPNVKYYRILTKTWFPKQKLITLKNLWGLCLSMHDVNTFCDKFISIKINLNVINSRIIFIQVLFKTKIIIIYLWKLLAKKIIFYSFLDCFCPDLQSFTFPKYFYIYISHLNIFQQFLKFHNQNLSYIFSWYFSEIKIFLRKTFLSERFLRKMLFL